MGKAQSDQQNRPRNNAQQFQGDSTRTRSDEDSNQRSAPDPSTPAEMLRGEYIRKQPKRLSGKAQSPRRTSNISGTTARTSLTNQELAEYNSEEMIDNLPDLFHYASQIVDLIAPHDVSDNALNEIKTNLRNVNSRFRKNLTKYTTFFNRIREKYGRGPYINISSALVAILNQQSESGIEDGQAWRPDEIFYKANLAAAIDELQRTRCELGDSELPLEKMDRDFPEPFLSRLVGATDPQSTGDSTLSKETFALALEIRTQFALQFLRDNFPKANFDPDHIIREIFLGSEDNPTSVKGWGVDGLRALKQPQKNAITRRIDAIRKHFRDDDEAVQNQRTVDIEGLYEAFPLTVLVRRLFAWVRKRSDEMDTHVEVVGGAHAIQSALEERLKAGARDRVETHDPREASGLTSNNKPVPFSTNIASSKEGSETHNMADSKRPSQ